MFVRSVGSHKFWRSGKILVDHLAWYMHANECRSACLTDCIILSLLIDCYISSFMLVKVTIDNSTHLYRNQSDLPPYTLFRRPPSPLHAFPLRNNTSTVHGHLCVRNLSYEHAKNNSLRLIPYVILISASTSHDNIPDWA
jgi:hypothetical protein